MCAVTASVRAAVDEHSNGSVCAVTAQCMRSPLTCCKAAVEAVEPGPESVPHRLLAPALPLARTVPVPVAGL